MRELRAGGVEAQAERLEGGRRLLVPALAAGERGVRPGMIVAGQRPQAFRDGVRLVELAELGQRLDQIARDGERARLVDPLALRVLPHGAQVRGRKRRLVREQGRLPERARGLERRPGVAARGGLLQRGLPPAARLGGIAAAHREQRAAALIGRRDQEHAVVGVGPFVEEAGGRVPVAGAQLELGEVQAQPGVGDALAALRRQLEVALGDGARGGEFPPPGMPKPGDRLGRVDQVRGLRARAGRRAGAPSGSAPRPARCCASSAASPPAGSASSAHASASATRSTPSATVLSAFSASTCARSSGVLAGLVEGALEVARASPRANARRRRTSSPTRGRAGPRAEGRRGRRAAGRAPAGARPRPRGSPRG